MLVSLCDSEVYPNFDFGVDNISTLNAYKESFLQDANANSILQSPCCFGESTSLIVAELIELLRGAAPQTKEEVGRNLTLAFAELGTKQDWEQELSRFEQRVIVGDLNVLGGWVQPIC